MNKEVKVKAGLQEVHNFHLDWFIKEIIWSIGALYTWSHIYYMQSFIYYPLKDRKVLKLPT